MAGELYKGSHDNGEIEIKQSNIVFENDYVRIYNDDVTFAGGFNGTYIRVCQQFDSSVAILPITPDGRILMIKNFRHGARGWCYEIPKGGVEFSEECTKAAERELIEETGYTSCEFIEFGEYFDSPAIMSGSIKCYIALNVRKVGTIRKEPTEAIENVIEVDIDDFLQGKYRLDFDDALTELLLYKYIYEYGR